MEPSKQPAGNVPPGASRRDDLGGAPGETLLAG
jgi:hypothetical protein